jgi:hypothetical protein
MESDITKFCVGILPNVMGVHGVFLIVCSIGRFFHAKARGPRI